MTETAAARGSIGLFGVAAIGIGSMVGAGIFALLGQAAVAAGRDVYASFLIAGLIAFLCGLSYARLAVRYPSNGGIAEYLRLAFPSGLVARSLTLVYYMTLLITVAIVAKAFGNYATGLLFGEHGRPWLPSLFAAGIVIVLALLNLAGSRAVGRAEVALVAVKLGILALLMAAGLPGIDSAMLAQGKSVGLTELIASVALTFFAYAGFGMMANAAADVETPARTLPRAILLAIGLVVILYISLAMVVLGNLPAADLVKYADTAVARAAEPVLGHFGFIAVSVGALIATASAMNATLFSILNLGKALCGRGEGGLALARWLLGSSTGFLTVVAVIVAVIYLFDLNAIANVAGGAFLISYLAVFVAHWRLMGEAGGSRVTILGGSAMIIVVLAVLFGQIARTQPAALGLFAVLLLASVAVAWAMEERQ
jgi:amino acid transporter